MTTKPRAKKFRIRRSAAQPTQAPDTPTEPQAPPAPKPAAPRRAAAAQPAAAQPRPARVPQKPATPAQPQQAQAPTATPAPASPPAPAPAEASTSQSPEQALNAIRREGLTGRQLRMARRVAQKHGLAATSDFDAVRLLRERGIDPFQRANMLELVPGDENGEGKVQLPQTATVKKTELSTETISPSDRRMREISEIQQDIARRRRRKLALLSARLGIFVFLPTFLAGLYFYVIATPMYATTSQFLILQADSAGGSGIGGLLSGTQFATNQDSIATQSYLQSKDAMVRLDKDEGYKAHFANPDIDPIQRLSPDASNEEAYKLYKKTVKIGYDPTEGVIRMEVIAAEPEVSARFSRALISYAESRVDDLSRRKREDQMKDARASLELAKVERRAAQANLVALQEGTLLDPEGLIAGLRGQINNVEMQLTDKELQLQALLDNRSPNPARVDGVQGDIRRLKSTLNELQAKMTQAAEGEASLAQKTAQIQMAQADLATADLFLQSALQNEKQTELEANRQVRYLTTNVEPVASQDPSYPRAFENTILAFLILSGIYLMVSLTASILREQVSS